MTRRKPVVQENVNVPNGALIQANIEAAMRALPLWLPSNVCEYYIPLLAEEYVNIAFASLRSAPPLTKKEIESQLSKIKAQGTALLTSLARLKEPISEAVFLAMKDADHTPGAPWVIMPGMMTLNPRPRTLGEIMTHLQTLINAAHLAKIPNTAKNRRGRDRKLDALQIAKAAARDFRCLTGNAPDRSKNKNGFPDFLAAIFKALDRRGDSVENLAKQACEWWNNDRPLEDDAIFETLKTLPSVLEE